jgi:lactoylglutathione lyase
MKISHIAIWTSNLEHLSAFYCTWFECRKSDIYHNPIKQFTSCFLYFSDNCSIELMHHPNLLNETRIERVLGFAHIAISTGSREKVDELTRMMENQGICIKSNPRKTGDGFYESIVLDPDGNWIEITE